MRVAILAHSFSRGFELYKGLQDLTDNEFFIILSPSPQRSASASLLANIGRLLFVALKGFDVEPLKVLLAKRLVFLRGPFHDSQSLDTLKRLNLDIGLHRTGVIYRDVTIQTFSLGILNHHIGILPAYRGRSVLEWSILQGDPVGITVFFVNSGIDTGSRILVSERIDISECTSVFQAKQYLFNLDVISFRKALVLLRQKSFAFLVNDASGTRYFVMSKLFTAVAEQLLRQNVGAGNI